MLYGGCWHYHWFWEGIPAGVQVHPMLPLQIIKGRNGLSSKLVNNMCDFWLACKLTNVNNWKIPSFQWSEFGVEIWFQSSKLLLAYITFQRSKSNSRLLKVSAHIQSIARSCLCSELQYPATGCSITASEAQVSSLKIVEIPVSKTSARKNSGIFAPVRAVNCSRGMRGLG